MFGYKSGGSVRTKRSANHNGTAAFLDHWNTKVKLIHRNRLLPTKKKKEEETISKEEAWHIVETLNWFGRLNRRHKRQVDVDVGQEEQGKDDNDGLHLKLNFQLRLQSKDGRLVPIKVGSDGGGEAMSDSSPEILQQVRKMMILDMRFLFFAYQIIRKISQSP